VKASLLVVAGEVSGDMHAAEVVREIRRREPGISVFGIGGDELRAVGMELSYHIREMAVFGPFAVLAKYPHFRRVFKTMVRQAEIRQPDAVLLIDYGGFNLRFAREVKKLGIPVLYYISPQVWASRRSRIYAMAEAVDRLMVIFPFEPEVYRKTDLRVDFVGHPLVDAAAEVLRKPLAELPWLGEPRIALLPGSRRQEIDTIMPVMIKTACLVEQSYPQCSFIFAAPNAEIRALILHHLHVSKEMPTRWETVSGQTRQVLRQATAALVTSGTATLEAALMHCPMVILYKISWILYMVARHLIKIPYIGMVNLVADRLLCEEFIQDEASPQALARALGPILEYTNERECMIQGLNEVCCRLGEGGAAGRVAVIVQEALREKISDR